MSEATTAKDIKDKGKILSAQRPLIMDEPELDTPTTIRMARIGFFCLLITGLTMAVLNSSGLLKASRDLPVGDLRTTGELWATEWHGLMQAAGPASVTLSVRESVQWLRKRKWPAQDEDEPKSVGTDQMTREAVTARLAKCLTAPQVRREMARQQDVKAKISGKPVVITAITQLKDNAYLMNQAAQLCGFVNGTHLQELLSQPDTER